MERVPKCISRRQPKQMHQMHRRTNVAQHIRQRLGDGIIKYDEFLLLLATAVSIRRGIDNEFGMMNEAH